MIVRDAGARAAGAAVADHFVAFGPANAVPDPVSWPGYPEQRRRARERSGAHESVLCGDAVIGRTEVVVIAFDFEFMRDSVGVAGAADIVHAFARAVRRDVPVVSLVATGGCRMQEGTAALAGM